MPAIWGKAGVAPTHLFLPEDALPLPARRLRFAAATSAFTLITALTFACLPAQAAPPESGANPAGAVPGRYVVTLKAAPIATYGGEVKGLRATRPADGRKVDARSGSAKRYRSYLEGQHDRTAGRV